MRLRALWVVAALALVPSAAQAGQAPVNPGTIRAAETVHLNNAAIDKVIPLLRTEAKATSASWWDRQPAAQRAMTKQEYVALKNALMIAKRDAADAKRLSALPFDDGSRAVRQANATFYRANAARLDSALAGVPMDPICGLCAPGPSVPAGRR